MILARETKKKFGYWPKSKGKWSKDQLLYLCLACNKKIKTNFESYFKKKSALCQPCITSKLRRQRTSNLTGKKYGNLMVLSAQKRVNNKVHIECQCECGNVRFLDKYFVNSGILRFCGRTCRLKVSKSRKGYKNLTGSFWSSIKHNAKTRGLEFNINIEYAHKLLVKQQYKCKLSGVEISLSGYFKDRKQNTCSLDRIDSSKGYIKENLQWVHKDINWMKGDKTDMKFIEICKAVAKHNRTKS